MKVLRDDMHVLTGSYALDALDDPEREEFERHLQHCPSCDAEVGGLRETAARIAMASAVAPPTRMERWVLAASYRTRQLPPQPGPGVRRPDQAQVARLSAGQRGLAHDERFLGPRSGREAPTASCRPSWCWRLTG